MMSVQPQRVLTIAGSDSGGSAGIQADLKTLMACGVFGMTAITVVTAQNTLAVQQAFYLPLDLIDAQIEAVLSDMGADAVKTGLLGRSDVVNLVADRVTALDAMPIVVDPVLVNGQGNPIVAEEAVEAYRQRLLPLATVITPNLDEAVWLAQIPPIGVVDDFYTAARRLFQMGAKAVLIKGGHLDGEQKIDLFFDGEEFTVLKADSLPIDNPHGVGCTLASAIAAGLAQGASPLTAVCRAHAFLQNALHGALDWQLGRGRPTVNHYKSSSSPESSAI